MVEGLVPCISSTVALLRAHRFNATDSGDGESSVYCACEPWELVNSAGRLLKALRLEGVNVEPGNIQAMFDPVDNTAGILLTCIGDRELASTKPRYTSDSEEGEE